MRTEIQKLKRDLDVVQRQIYFDAGRDIRRTTLLLGSARSGTTWLQEVLNHDQTFRVIFEPFHGLGPAVAQGFRNRFIPPAVANPNRVQRFETVLRGRFRNKWSNQYNSKRIVGRRLIKEIQITNLLPWISAQFPSLGGIVYLIRNPWAVADSRLGPEEETGPEWWSDLNRYLEQPSLMEGPFRSTGEVLRRVQEKGSHAELLVARWCAENFIPIATPGRATFVFYEDLVRRPVPELSRLCDRLHVPWPADIDKVLDKPSQRTSSRVGLTHMSSRIDRWKVRFGPKDVSTFRGILGSFGLAALYDDDGMPTIGPDDVATYASGLAASI
jgi:Sulfotransferase family